MTENEIRADTLLKFADHIDLRRPTAIQLQLNPEYNNAAANVLKWVSEQARTMAGNLKKIDHD